MTIGTRGGVLLGVALTLGVLPLIAQEPSPGTAAAKKDAPADAKRAHDPARRVPDYFGQIGLTPEQRESIYKVRARHQAEIDALEKQIVEAQAKMLAECEAVLDTTQKHLLENRRRAAAATRKAQDAAKPAKDGAKSGS